MLVDWNCPNCGNENEGIEDEYCNCAYCRQSVYVVGKDDVIDYGSTPDNYEEDSPFLSPYGNI